MNRKTLIGVAIGAILAGAPILYLSKTDNAFEIDSDNSSVVAAPDATKGNDGPLKDYLYQADIGTPSVGGAFISDAVNEKKAELATGPIPPNFPLDKALAELNGKNVEAASAAISENRIREIVREEIKANPALVVDAIRTNAGDVLNALNSYLDDQRKLDEKKANEKTLSFADRLTKSEGYPYLGNPNGAVEVFYYFDANCHYCKQLEPELDRFVADNPDVKLVHRELPILADSSRYAAEVSGLLFARNPAKYGEFHHALMALKPGMANEDIDTALANVIGLDNAAPIISAARDPKGSDEAQTVAKRIGEDLQLAADSGITGTPFVVVKGTDIMLRGAEKDSYAKLQSAAVKIRAAADAAKAEDNKEKTAK